METRGPRRCSYFGRSSSHTASRSSDANDKFGYANDTGNRNPTYNVARKNFKLFAHLQGTGGNIRECVPRSLAIMPPCWSCGLSTRDFTPTMSMAQSEDADVRLE